MAEDKIRAERLALIVAVTIWLAYEAVMAVALRETFTVNDYAALAGKIAYLTGLLVTSIKGLNAAATYAAVVSPTAAAAVRGSMGWLSYTLFTVIVPAIGAVSAAYLTRRGRPQTRYLTLANAVALALYAATLPGNLYVAPESPRLLEVVFLPAFAIVSLYYACMESQRYVYPVVGVMLAAPLLAMAA